MLERYPTNPLEAESANALVWHRGLLRGRSWDILRRYQMLVFCGLYVLLSIAVFGGIAVYVVEERLVARDPRHAELMQELERLEISRHTREAELEVLRDQADAHAAELRQVRADNATLAQALARGDAERAALEDERERARERAERLEHDAQKAALWLETSERERLILEARLAAFESERAILEQHRAGLHARLEMAEMQLAELRADQESATKWLNDWISERLQRIETVLLEAGVTPDRLIAASPGDGSSTAASPVAASFGRGLGGPYLPAVDDVVPSFGLPAGLGLSEPAAQSLSGGLERLAAGYRLLATVPLATPLDHYHQTSAFGPRTDPISRRKAAHNGLDFGAPAGSKVLVTAPGRVVHAGRAGSYGLLVEVDHGNGITSRYAHLSRLLVEEGATVGFRQPIGIIGNSGRSTGRHLHYEIRLDGEVRDPAGFIAAGRRLINALGS